MLNRVRYYSDQLIFVQKKWLFVLAIGAGALAALGQAPFHLFPLLWISFPLLVLLLDCAVPPVESRGHRRLLPAFWVGYGFGLGYFVVGFWWLGSAFLVNAEAFAWALPLAVIGLPAMLALFFGLASAFARLFWRDGWARLLVLAASFGVFEWLRATIFSGFPWNGLGLLLAPNQIMMQGIALLGTFTYGVLAVLIFSLPTLVIMRSERRRVGDFVVGGGTILVLIGLVGFGGSRLANAPVKHLDDLRLRIIQPNIAQKDKFKPELSEEIIKRYLDMSARRTGPDDLGLLTTTHLIWPESAFPFFVTERPDVLTAIADLLPTGTSLITGAVRSVPGQVGSDKDRRIFNSLYTITHEGVIRDAYDKVKLVPFGEYLPFKDVLERFNVDTLAETPGGFSAGPSPRVMELPGAPDFIPLICYEIIFPFQASDQKLTQKAQWILNVTNDAWFGPTPGPHQHFHQARIRAVDEGLPVIRAANSGISAVIDGYGRVEQSLRLGESGIINTKLPVRVKTIVSQKTKFQLFWFLIVFLLTVSILTSLNRLWRKY